MILTDILRVNPREYLGPLADILRPAADVDRWIRAYCEAPGSYAPWKDYAQLCGQRWGLCGWGWREPIMGEHMYSCEECAAEPCDVDCEHDCHMPDYDSWAKE